MGITARVRFLMKIFHVAFLLVFLCSLGATHKEIDAFWSHQTIVSGGAGTSWATWDETHPDAEEGWGDQANNFIVLANGLNAGDDEIGIGGGLTGANLVFTDNNNNIDGLVGSYRQFTAADNSNAFQWTEASAESFFASRTSWSFLIKAEDVDAGVYISTVLNAAHYLYLERVAGTNVLKMHINDGTSSTTASTVNAIPSTGVVWFAIWGTGADVKFGFKATTRPVAEADFAANDMGALGAASDFTAAGISVTRPAGHTVSCIQMKWHLCVFSNLDLFY